MSRKLVRLKESGHFDGESKVKDDKSQLDKQAMLVYTGKFESMDGPVEIKDEDIEKLAANHNTLMSKLGRLASGDVHPRHNPPLQLDHSTSARDTVGRLVGGLTIGEHTLEDGSKVKALMGTARVLGKENVEKVEDGRWTHLSGGFDLENHKVSELTITPFPAAGEAHMLSKKRLKKELQYKDETIKVYNSADDDWHWETRYHSGIEKSEAEATAKGKEDIDEFKKKHPNLSSEETMGMKEIKEKAALYEKCRKHLTEQKKMSEEDADKHLEAAKDEDLKSMAEEHDEHLKHLAEEEAKKKEDEERLKASMTAHKPALVKMAKAIKVAGSKVQLAARVSKIQTRLSKLRSEAKITPAEVKALKIDELAAKADDVIDAALSSYDKRQPVIDTGLYGSTKATNPAKLAGQLKKLNMEREELQTRLNMPSKRAEALSRMAEIDKREQDLAAVHEEVGPDQDPKAEAAFEAAYAEHGRLIGEGKHDEAKEHLRSYMKSLHHMGGEPGHVSDPTPAMSALAAEVKNMQNEFVEFVKLTAPSFGATVEELT